MAVIDPKIGFKIRHSRSLLAGIQVQTTWMPDYNLGHDEKTIIFMFACKSKAHVDSRLSGLLPKAKKDSP
ncbi:MAG: hypothetical protein MUO31_05790 [Thermodesulfovibrionales bacterium]|jgi:hypothetical protein|nr:hypothetical protein [Thermodesulfovibrionales bacterium]